MFEAHANEVTGLIPPGRPLDGLFEHSKRVSPTCVVHFERHRYSVPTPFPNRPATMRIYPKRIVIAAAGQILREDMHGLSNDPIHLPGRTIYDWRH